MNTKALKKIQLNHKRNLAQDNTEDLDRLAADFDYHSNDDQYWNPQEFSLLWGTPLWNQASDHEKKVLNHLYWVAYYAQIISAEIATIFFNQTSAASLYCVRLSWCAAPGCAPRTTWSPTTTACARPWSSISAQPIASCATVASALPWRPRSWPAIARS